MQLCILQGAQEQEMDDNDFDGCFLFMGHFTQEQLNVNSRQLF